MMNVKMTRENMIDLTNADVIRSCIREHICVGITHGGKEAHADEVFTTAALLMAGVISSVARVNSVPDLPDELDRIIYDIGGVYDPEKNCFDHHQKGFAKTREGDKVKMSSLGLVMETYGGLLCHALPNGEDIWRRLDNELFRGIDAVDNGMAKMGDCLSIASAIAAFNVCWDDPDADADAAFVDAVNFAIGILQRQIKRIASKIAAEKVVMPAIERAEGQICILDEFAPFEEYVKDTDLLYVIFPSDRGGYMLWCVPKFDEEGKPTWESRKQLPESWRGLRDQELAEVCGIDNSMFCHPDGFCGGAYTLADTVAMAVAARDAE